MSRGRAVFVIGGGESIKDIDLQPLQYEHVIAVNSSHLCGVANEVVTGDRRWMNQRARAVPSNLPLTFCRSTRKAKPLPKIGRPYDVIKTNGVTSRWGRSKAEGVVAGDSGMRAVNYALLLEAPVVFLLGFDLEGEWWHDDYFPSWKSKRSAAQERLTMWHNLMADPLSSRIVNLTPNRALPAPFRSYQEVLDERS